MRTIHAAGRADADDGDVAIVQLIGQLRGGGDPAILVRGLDQGIEARFIHRRTARIEGIDFRLSDIDPDHAVALTGDAASRS